MFTDSSRYNVSNSQDLVDLNQIPIKLITNNQESTTNFMKYLKLRMMFNSRASSYICGLRLGKEELLSYKLKEKAYETISFILSTLVVVKLDLNEVELIKRKILIAIDNASKEFLLVIEFCKLTTTISYLSIPEDIENQTKFHIDREMQETMVLTSRLDAFNNRGINDVIKNTDQTARIMKSENWMIGFAEKINSVRTDINSITFRLSDDPFLKLLEKDFILNKLSAKLPDDSLKEEYNSIRIILKEPGMMFGFRLETFLDNKAS